MAGTRIKESKNGELSLVRSKEIKDGVEDYALSDKLRNLCESICKRKDDKKSNICIAG